MTLEERVEALEKKTADLERQLQEQLKKNSSFIVDEIANIFKELSL